jgi:hypothetical protein
VLAYLEWASIHLLHWPFTRFCKIHHFRSKPLEEDDGDLFPNAKGELR